MALPKDFWSRLPLREDHELYGMLAQPDDYLPEALAAAREELAKRKLAPERVAQLDARLESQKAVAQAHAQERLGWPMRILIFLFCAGLIGILLAAYYDSKGYKQKARDCWVTLGVVMLAHLFLGGLLYVMR